MEWRRQQLSSHVSTINISHLDVQYINVTLMNNWGIFGHSINTLYCNINALNWIHIDEWQIYEDYRDNFLNKKRWWIHKRRFQKNNSIVKPKNKQIWSQWTISANQTQTEAEAIQCQHNYPPTQEATTQENLDDHRTLENIAHACSYVNNAAKTARWPWRLQNEQFLHPWAHIR